MRPRQEGAQLDLADAAGPIPLLLLLLLLLVEVALQHLEPPRHGGTFAALWCVSSEVSASG